MYRCCPLRKNYSGVAILHNCPKWTTLEAADFDEEGRLLAVDFISYILIAVYTPHSGVGDLKRLDYRVDEWDRQFEAYINNLKETYQKPVVVCGDMNIIPHDADIYNPGSKVGRPGTTERERNSFLQIQKSTGLIDAFRKLYPLRQLVYSHWTDRCGTARKNNWGSRMDYFLAGPGTKVVDVKYYAQIEGSDHCPVSLTYDSEPQQDVGCSSSKKRSREEFEEA